jgi:hypothetical protein
MCFDAALETVSMFLKLVGNALTGLLVVTGTVAVLTAPAYSQTTPLQATIALRPVTRGDIAAYKLPSTIQTSGGLRNVALGTPAYLEVQVPGTFDLAGISSVTWTLTMKPPTSKSELAESPLGKAVPVYEPSDRLVLQVAGRTILVPDAPGQYEVWATITTTKGETIKTGQTIFGATYVGISACATCHSGGMAQNMAVSWSKTAHATIFKDGVNGVASDHYAASCLGCHTVGYDTTAGAVNGAFDDVAAQVKWTFPTTQKPGTFEAMPDALKNVSNIQCENCHGPGSMHAAGASKLTISANRASGDCAVCHDAPTHHIKNGEWNNSRHAVVTREASGTGHEGCVGCHTGAGFADKMKGATPPDTAYSAINCQSCHEPHGQTTPDKAAHLVRTIADVTLADGTVVTEGGNGKLCMNCHQSRQNANTYAATAAASARFGPHHSPQADMLQGTNGFVFNQFIPSSAHWFAVEDSCVTCHMQTVAETDKAFTHAGGHTFAASWTPDETSAPRQMVAACQTCHGPKITTFDFPLMDYDGDGKIDGVQTEVQHLLDKVSSLLPPVGKAKTALTIDSTWTRTQLEAGYNWQFVAEDKSKGIHNTAYAVGLLKTSIAFLQNEKK